MGLEPAKLTDFQLKGALGSGATANVYEAAHVATGRPVAIKLMAEATESREMRERFAREALLLSEVQSRHVTKIVGYGFETGRPFLVLERLHGETLDAKLRRDGAVPMAAASRWIEQLLVGVRDCHDAKVIHRDIKPANIFLHQEGAGETVKLIDFGVARLREIAGGDPGALTSPSHVIGSMGYMAPEQFKSAKSVGFSADLYAVGVVIFRALSGRLPFVSRSLEAVIRMKIEQPVPSLSAMPGMVKNAMLDWVVAKAMAKNPEDRFQSAREMLDHWRNVALSIDEGSDLGRVDESYAGRLPSPPSGGTRTGHPDDFDDRTDPHARPASISSPDSTSEDLVPILEDVAPETIPFGGRPGELAGRVAGVAGDDTDENPFEKATRPDADLRAIVERERELEKARRRGR